MSARAACRSRREWSRRDRADRCGAGPPEQVRLAAAELPPLRQSDECLTRYPARLVVTPRRSHHLFAACWSFLVPGGQEADRPWLAPQAPRELLPRLGAERQRYALTVSGV